MKTSVQIVISISIFFLSGQLWAQQLPRSVKSFVQDNCVTCHDSGTATRFDLHAAAFALDTVDQRRFWTDVYDQIATGAMPPASAPQPTRAAVDNVNKVLKHALHSATRTAQQSMGRVPARRLTRTEYKHSVRDVLSISGEFGENLPLESSEGTFDTAASTQNFSAMHMESYLAAANQAIDIAIRLHKSPFRKHKFDLLNNEHLNSFHERDLQVGGNISRKLEDGVAIFRDVDYLLRSDLHGFRVRSTGSGYYRISVSAEAFQSKTPVAMKVIVKDISGESNLVGACDLVPGETKTLIVDAWMTRTKVFYVSFMEDRPAAQILADIYDDGGGNEYSGPGIKVNSITVEGPQTGGWPPQSTRQIFRNVDLQLNEDQSYGTKLAKPPIHQVADIVADVGQRAFRRPLSLAEKEVFVATAKPTIDADQEFDEVVRAPIQAILSSPQFVLLTGPAGQLDDYSLASRLSYFLWKSVPDQQLMKLADNGTLNSETTLTSQIDRMLSDSRANRFVEDFLGQWLRLNEINATTPDEKLYPEYDELLHWSISQETTAFFSELILKNLSIANFIDSDFTFLNHRLATHYGIRDVIGQDFRRIELPDGSPRGGVLTQAAILKVTSNGLVTSPVKRGDFVLSDLFGTPPPPPPDGIGAIEPDVSQTTTIRELLAAHRDSDACLKCHQKIDPPGFAMECFDPTGAFRTHYRISADDFLTFVAHAQGAEVDSSGTTADGVQFSGIDEFKTNLMKQKEQLAKHFIQQLIVYSTGGEIEFSDREVVEEILNNTREAGFPVRTIIHEVINCRLFQER